MSGIIRIRIPSKWAVTDGCSLLPCAGVADFKLGEGPCGKVVTGLSLGTSVIPDAFSLIQTHSDGSVKVFHYRTEDLIGRVEIEAAGDDF